MTSFYALELRKVVNNTLKNALFQNILERGKEIYREKDLAVGTF